MLVDILPQGLKDFLGQDLVFWLGYISNGKHLNWYASVQYTLAAMVLGAAIALVVGLVAAAARSNGPLPLRWFAAAYINIVRGVPDVLFFLFFPLAFEQAVEWVRAQAICSPSDLGSGHWPPCPDANLILGTPEYLILAAVSLGIVYGAFAGNVIAGAMNAVPKGQLEAARAFGMSPLQVMTRIHIRQMWVYALPGLSNVWMLLFKSTSLLSLLQISDIVLWADRLGAPNFSRSAGFVHPDWRWAYYLILLIFYIIITFISEKVFAALTRWAGRGMATAGAV